MKLILPLILFLSVTASAATDCEKRLSDVVHALIHVLESAVTKEVLKRGALENILAKPGLSSPFASASEHVLREQYQGIFENLVRDLSKEGIVHFKTALAAHLEEKAVSESISRQ